MSLLYFPVLKARHKLRTVLASKPSYRSNHFKRSVMFSVTGLTDFFSSKLLLLPLLFNRQTRPDCVSWDLNVITSQRWSCLREVQTSRLPGGLSPCPPITHVWTAAGRLQREMPHPIQVTLVFIKMECSFYPKTDSRGLEPATFCSAVKSSNHWAEPIIRVTQFILIANR